MYKKFMCKRTRVVNSGAIAPRRRVSDPPRDSSPIAARIAAGIAGNRKNLVKSLKAPYFCRGNLG